MRHCTVHFEILAAVLILSSMLSCTKFSDQNEVNPGVKMCLDADCSGGTKTLNDGISTLWSGSDQINLIHNPALGGEYFSEIFTHQSGKTFTGTVHNVESVNNWYAFYPYDQVNRNPSSIAFNVSNYQVQEGNGSTAHLAGKTFPLYGQRTGVELSSSLSLTMQNILSVADFCITNGHNSPITIQSVEFSSICPIAGAFVGDFTSPQPKYTPCSGSGATVGLAINNATEIAPGASAHFFAGVLPHIMPESSKLSVRITANVNGSDITVPLTKTLPSDASFKPGKLKTINLTFNLQGEWQSATHNLENKQITEFLDAAEEKYTDNNYKTVSVAILYCLGCSSSNRLDAPAPVNLSWSTSTVGVKTVRIYRDIFKTELEMETTTNGNSVDIMNLTPGRRYRYEVLSEDGTLLAADTFTTIGRRRMVKVSDEYDDDHANNFRDLGGLKTVEGKQVKYGKLFRGTNVDNASQQEKDYIKGYLNVGLDVDLRTYQTSSLGDDVDFINGDYTGDFSEFKVGKENGQFKKIFAKIVNNLTKGNSVYIHCRVGADRTGYVCILLLSALGVSPKDCSIDYELTSFSVVGLHPRNSIFTTMCREGISYIKDYEGDSYQHKAWNILKGYGVPQEQIDSFCEMMLEDTKTNNKLLSPQP